MTFTFIAVPTDADRRWRVISVLEDATDAAIRKATAGLTTHLRTERTHDDVQAVEARLNLQTLLLREVA